MEQLLAAAREARRAAEISQEGRVQEQSLTQHLAAARIQRRYREQSGRRVLREVRQAAAGTVQSAWSRPATAPGRQSSTSRALTPEPSDGSLGRPSDPPPVMDTVGAAEEAGGRGAGAEAEEAMGGGMGGMPGPQQQARIDQDMAWLAAMGMPVSEVEYKTKP
jgi:hypothetical protein